MQQRNGNQDDDPTARPTIVQDHRELLPALSSQRRSFLNVKSLEAAYSATGYQASGMLGPVSRTLSVMAGSELLSLCPLRSS